MRKQGWEKLLADYIHDQREAPFEWGVNDCILFASHGANLILEKDYTDEIKSYGHYDEEGAYEILRAHGGKIEDIFDKYLERHDNILMARRGDIAVVEYCEIVQAGIINTSGTHVSVKTEKGLFNVPVRKIRTAWRID